MLSANLEHRTADSGAKAEEGRRLRVLLSAYACEPGKGSEPGVGWNWIRQTARFNDVWVLTRANNRLPIEAALAREPIERAHFIYYDLHPALRFWKKRQRGIRLYYYLWQIGAYLHAREVHARVKFDIAHHVTFVKYWMPSLVCLLPVPFIWGPVGGGESMPAPFRTNLSRHGRWYEFFRDIARAIGECDPLVRITARRAALGLATTDATKARLLALGCRNVRVYGESGLTDREIASLGSLAPRTGSIFRILSSGNLLHLKGFELSLRAFAMAVKAGLHGEYWFLGDGPERDRLKALAADLDVTDRVVFWGRLERSGALEKLADCDVLVHPSLHDSGGWVCLEAMAAGRPVICLDIGGPGMQVSGHTGIKVAALNPEQAVRHLAAAIHLLSRDAELRERLSLAGREFVAESFAWTKKAECMRRNYLEFAHVSRSQSSL